ncbi:MAG: hypothetical protein HFJ04_06060 [Lachnospiraceae bacterium]|nr:hypothetical protein [Lachnospiraceae bacterium]
MKKTAKKLKHYVLTQKSRVTWTKPIRKAGSFLAALLFIFIISVAGSVMHAKADTAFYGFDAVNTERGTQLIVSRPADQAVKTGEEAIFSVNSSGGNLSGIHCQWYYAASQTETGTPIQGANTFIYVLKDTKPSYNGRYYYCIVQDGQNSVTSSRARLTVYSPPTVSSPESVTVVKGQSAVFSVTASGGNPAKYTYQWYYYAINDLENHKKIDGATSSSYRISAVPQYVYTRYYYCVVSNGIYNVRPEQAAMLTVKSVPVKKKKQKITASSLTVAYGTDKSLNAKSNGDGYLTYTSSNSKVAKVSSFGWITAKNYGKATITIKASGTDGYKAATKKITVTVIPKTAVLTQANSYGSSKLSLKWKKDKTVTGYELNISRKKNFKSDTLGNTFKASKTSTRIVGFLSGKTYYARVRSYKKIGRKIYNGNWSKVKKVKIK